MLHYTFSIPIFLEISLDSSSLVSCDHCLADLGLYLNKERPETEGTNSQEVSAEFSVVLPRVDFLKVTKISCKTPATVYGNSYI